MIEIASYEMIPRLKEIWKKCFHDEDWYIDFYFKERFSKVETLVYTIDDNPVAMATLIPGEICYQQTKINIRYVYAVATDPIWQGKGLASELIQYINTRVDKEYQGTILVPASKGLFEYYTKLGYQIACNKKVVHLSMEDQFMRKNSEERIDVNFSELSAIELYHMREERYAEIGYVKWDINGLDYVMSEWQLCKGKVVKVETLNETGSLFYFYDDNHKILYIKETTLSHKALRQALLKLAESIVITRIELIEPVDSKMHGETLPFMMFYGDEIHSLNYANFVKD